MPKTITEGNWFCKAPPLEDGDIVEGGNFCQAVADTEIAAGVTNLTINGGNWINVKAQPSWAINGGNWAKIDYCAHLHPLMVTKGYLLAEPDDCAHVVDTDTVTIDGQVVDTIYHREDTVL